MPALIAPASINGDACRRRRRGIAGVPGEAFLAALSDQRHASALRRGRPRHSTAGDFPRNAERPLNRKSLRPAAPLLKRRLKVDAAIS